jgi:hypothetical protein
MAPKFKNGTILVDKKLRAVTFRVINCNVAECDFLVPYTNQKVRIYIESYELWNYPKGCSEKYLGYRLEQEYEPMYPNCNRIWSELNQ